MNKIININLGGIAFTLDENAYQTLAQYIETLRQHFAASEGCDEIVADIEARIAELFSEYLKDRNIVALADVKRAISVMGIPTEIEGNTPTEDAANQQTNANNADKNGSWKTGKRLFRNTDDRVLGGVCSGLSAYLGISDPLWLRLAFIASLFVGGVGFFIYFVLMLVVPPALTAADRLSMRGEDINTANIARNVEQEMAAVGSRLNEFGQEVFGKKPNGGTSFAANASDRLVDILKVLIKGGLLFFAACGIFALAVTLIALLIAGVMVQPYASFYLDSNALGIIGWIALLAMTTIPLIGLVLGCLRIFNKRLRVNSLAIWGLVLAFIGALLTFIIVLASYFRQHDVESSSKHDISLASITSDTLNLIQLKDATEDNINTYNFGDDVKISGGNLIGNNIDIDIEPSADNQFHLIQTNRAYSKNEAEAYTAADAIIYEVKVENGKVFFPCNFTLNKTAKWNWQSVRLILQVPVGKYVKINNDMTRLLADFEIANDDDWSMHNHFQEGSEYPWRMTQKGLVCDNCPQKWSSANNDDPDGNADDDEPTIINENDFNGDVNIDAENGALHIKTDSTDIKIDFDKDGLKVRKRKNNKTNSDEI